MKTYLHLKHNQLARRAAILAVAVVTLGLGSFSPTQGLDSPPRPPGYQTATGDFNDIVSDVYTDVGYIGDVFVQREDLVFNYAGDITGTATDVNYLFYNPDGSFNSAATEVCTGCTIGGRTGSFTARYVIQGNSFSDYTGYLVFTGGTGGLAGLRGFGTFGYDGVTTFYTYYYTFARR